MVSLLTLCGAFLHWRLEEVGLSGMESSEDSSPLELLDTSWYSAQIATSSNGVIQALT